jgi:hypothetical protein
LDPAVADRVRGRPQMVGIMVAVNPIEHFDAHAQKPGGFRFVDARLHEPSSARHRALISSIARSVT